MAEGQGKEMGAVLIAVNSYQNNPKYCLPYADRVLKGYIETFHQYLFFQVHVVVNYTLKTFKTALDDFIKICRKDEPTRIAVVLYGHGGVVHGKECIFTDILESLEIPTLQSVLHWQLDTDKYIFIDACRTSNQHYVLQVATPLTTLVRSTLVFGVATASAWSECFAMNLRKGGTLTQVLIKVNSDLGLDQNFEIQCQGPGDEPNFRQAAMDLYSDTDCIRELNSVLSQHISNAKLQSTKIREIYGLGSEPFIDRQPDDHFGDTPMELSFSIQGLATANLPPHLPPVAPLSKRQCNNPSKQPSAQGTQPSSTSSTQTMAGTTATSTTANQTPPNPPVAVITSPSDNPSKQPSAQGTQPSSTTSQTMAGTTATSTTGLDAVITSVNKILEYKKDMIAHQKVLGTVLGLDSMTDTILQGPNALNYTATLTKILETWMEYNQPQVTWRDLVTALEIVSNFNRLVYNIKEDHAA